MLRLPRTSSSLRVIEPSPKDSITRAQGFVVLCTDLEWVGEEVLVSPHQLHRISLHRSAKSSKPGIELLVVSTS